MKASDWIVKFLIEKKVSDVFGYPGGMAVHFMDSLSKAGKAIKHHTTYNEQGAVFAACGYAQISNNIGVAFSSSGPGFTNMVTGIANAYFDSIPLLVITFNVNTYESARTFSIKQRGFQEMDVVSVAENFTKKAFYVEKKTELLEVLERAYQIALSGRRGPVLIDIPMDISREEITCFNQFKMEPYKSNQLDITCLIGLLEKAERPCFILGAGLEIVERNLVLQMIENYKIPVITSMIAVDLIPRNHQYNYGFLGAYGMRMSNFIIAKSDLVITVGSRLDVRQVSTNLFNFAPDAMLIRCDIDENELSYRIKENELQIKGNIEAIVMALNYYQSQSSFPSWLKICNKIKEKLSNIDDCLPNKYIQELSKKASNGAIITTDVGQNQVWVAQSFIVKKNQRILFSGNFGSMGYSLPAAIGAYYASRKMIFSFNGDGGVQMNIQELQFIKREKLPIKIFILNNNSLGMIRHFQEMYMNCNYTMTTAAGGYSAPSFEKIAYGYDIPYDRITQLEQISSLKLSDDTPQIIEIMLLDDTHVIPKLAMKKANQDQEPLIDRDLFTELMAL